ncbi:helix-turn-helix domain-containing protein [Lutibacter sp.]|uniref:helix-turn-helix domain-containing protein n=1 Tax=Lutibacter sp. TaxID=1925666 RepID=UPI001A19D6B4|nr:helix-turn-helix domain-containing protein [Lutibacter sp.]MBI9040215.1 helix-turn-helix domain-containing protein [Lutibacter sp.]
MESKSTILLHNITPDEFKEALILSLKEVIQELLLETKKEKPLEYLTRKQVAEIFKISMVTISDWNKKGILKPYRIGNLIRYKSNEIEEALTEIPFRRYN